MEFIELKKLLQENFKEMTKNSTHLFEIAVDKDKLWDLYLDSFPAGTNEIFRERREYDCSCCRHFIKNIGAVAVIENNVIKTIWDFKTNDEKFQPVLDALSKYLKSKAVENVFVSKFKNIGTDKNFENADGKSIQWDHFFLSLPDKFVDKSSKSIPDIQGSLRDVRNVFKRSLDEISLESLMTVLELISQNSLYKGEEWKKTLNDFLNYKKQYDKLTSNKQKELFAWEQSVKAGAVVGKIRNHSMGTLLVNISEGMELDIAVKKYEQIVAPTNYKRPKAIFTKKMLEDAKKTITELGYMPSLQRRFATLDDITANNVLFSNRDAAKRMAGKDIFDEMSKSLPQNAKKFSKIEEISIKDFIEKVLPNAENVEVFLENKHSSNMVSLIAPSDEEAKSMFKWGNAFSWAYSGNMTDSDIKQNVKNAGGNVNGLLRFSIQWNDGVRETCDLDAHCKEPNGYEIMYRNKGRLSPTHGMLDIDIINPKSGVAAVENITWETLSRMENGEYVFFIDIFSGRLNGTVKAEIEYNGELYSFEADASAFNGKRLNIAKAVVNNGNVEIVPLFNNNSSVRSKQIWNLETQQFVPVSVVMFSPNYWDEQDGIGNRHYLFMLKDCINDENPNGFYNEYLKEDLLQHKRVFEALGGKMAVQDVEDQLSGLGFSSTQRNELVVKVKGATERTLKVKF